MSAPTGTTLPESERRRLLVDFNATERPFDATRCIHDRVAEQAARTPAAVAAEFGSRRLTYAELEAAAAAVAGALVAAGAGPGHVVGVVLDRSLELVTALLGVLKAGAAYLPIDPAWPDPWAAGVADDAGLELLVAGGAAPGPLVAGRRVITVPEAADAAAPGARVPDRRAGPDDLAYVIYTSGSTGRPKGVLVEHRGLGNLAEVVATVFAIGPASRVLQFASPAFDASVTEILVPLTVGATVCLADRAVLASGPGLVDLLARERITVATLPPSLLAVLPEAALPDLATICSAGEACPRGLLERWGRGRRFVNGYGPTEATVAACYQIFEPGDGAPGAADAGGADGSGNGGGADRAGEGDPQGTDVGAGGSAGDEPARAAGLPIGGPIANVRVYVLDPAGEPVAVGETGELHIAGVGVARGYLGRPELTAQRFLADPFVAGGRMYRTGDRARWRSDGTLEFVGRMDDQVKLRGFRIELGEVEQALAAHDDVADAAVVVREDTPGHRRLVGYVVAAPGVDDADLSPRLTDDLRRRLPAPMVPSALVVLDALPTTANGKVDRRALPRPGRPGPEAGPARPAVGLTPIEQAVSAVWCELLGLDAIDLHEDLFEAGVDSLMATKAAVRFRREFGVEVPVATVFETPTVAGISHALLVALEAEPPDA